MQFKLRTDVEELSATGVSAYQNLVHSILIVEDHTMLRECFRNICISRLGLKVFEAHDGHEAVTCAIRHRPFIVLLDIELENLNGLDALEVMRSGGICPRVLFVSGHLSPYMICRIEAAQGAGFIDKKTQTAAEIIKAIECVLLGKTFFSKSYQDLKFELRQNACSIDKILTGRQLAILSMVASLKTDKDIGEILHLSDRTVEAHRTAIMRKLEVHSRVELIRYAQANGFP